MSKINLTVEQIIDLLAEGARISVERNGEIFEIARIAEDVCGCEECKEEKEKLYLPEK